MVEHSNYDPKMHVCTKSESTSDSVLKVLGLSLGLFFASPFILLLGFLIIGCTFSLLFSTVPFIVPVALILFCGSLIFRAARKTISSKDIVSRLQMENDFLRGELLEAKKQISILEEGMEFHRNLEKSVAASKPEIQQTASAEKAPTKVVAMPPTISIAKN